MDKIKTSEEAIELVSQTTGLDSKAARKALLAGMAYSDAQMMIEDGDIEGLASTFLTLDALRGYNGATLQNEIDQMVEDDELDEAGEQICLLEYAKAGRDYLKSNSIGTLDVTNQPIEINEQDPFDEKLNNELNWFRNDPDALTAMLWLVDAVAEPDSDDVFGSLLLNHLRLLRAAIRRLQ